MKTSAGPGVVILLLSEPMKNDNFANLFQKLLEPFAKTSSSGAIDRFPISDKYRTSISEVAANAEIHAHDHDENNFNYVFNGEFVVTIEGKTNTYLKGEWFFIGAGQEHSAVAKSPVKLLEFWIDP